HLQRLRGNPFLRKPEPRPEQSRLFLGESQPGLTVPVNGLQMALLPRGKGWHPARRSRCAIGPPWPFLAAFAAQGRAHPVAAPPTAVLVAAGFIVAPVIAADLHGTANAYPRVEATA